MFLDAIILILSLALLVACAHAILKRRKWELDFASPVAHLNWTLLPFNLYYLVVAPTATITLLYAAICLYVLVVGVQTEERDE